MCRQRGELRNEVVSERSYAARRADAWHERHHPEETTTNLIGTLGMRDARANRDDRLSSSGNCALASVLCIDGTLAEQDGGSRHALVCRRCGVHRLNPSPYANAIPNPRAVSASRWVVYYASFPLRQPRISMFLVCYEPSGKKTGAPERSDAPHDATSHPPRWCRRRPRR